MRSPEKTEIYSPEGEAWSLPVAMKSGALTGIFILLFIYFLREASEILIPFTIAYSLNLLLSPLIRRLSRIGIPASFSAAIIVIIIVAASLSAIYSLSKPAEEWITRAPEVIQEVKQKIKPMLGSIAGAQRAAANVDALVAGDVSTETETVSKVTVSVEPEQSRLEMLLSNTSSTLGGIGITLVLLYFLLAAGDTFLNKMVTSIPKFQDKRRAVEIIRDIQRDTSRYLTARTLINLGLGCVVTLATYALGMPNPLLWGALAAVLNFAPYVGPAFSLGIITVAAIISMDTLSGALLVPAVVLLINIIEGEFISHQLIGKRLALSPLIVFVSIVFWGWLWGIAGALMAIPIIAAFNVVCQHVDSLQPISEFISDAKRSTKIIDANESKIPE